MDLVLLRAKSMEYLENKERFNPYFNGSSTSTTKALAGLLGADTFQSLF